MHLFVKKSIVLFFLTASFFVAQGQSCDTSNSSRSFFTYCQAGSSYTYTGNYTIDVRNGDTITINGNVTINGTLTINLLGASSFVVIQSPYTLTATNLTLTGSATGKNITVNGPSGKIDVTNTFNFGGMTVDLDGTGTITAGSITGAANVSCNSDGSCPNPTATSCTPAGSSFCTSGGFVTPIELLFFNASRKESQVNLSWSTASELNFDYFDVQRATTDLNFISIGKVEGNGTTTIRHDYSFTDELPLIGKNYYRLKSIDFDGFTEIFNIVAVDFEGEKKFHLSPNPSDGLSISAQVNFTPRDNSFVIVYDNVGSMVGKFQLNGSASSFNFSEQLKPGVYYAKYSSDDFSKVSRFLVKE